MNTLSKALILFCLLLLVAPAVAQTVDPESWSPTWINPSWERPANMIPESPISLPGDLTVDQLEQPAICRGCHNVIFEQWEGGVHGNALNDPIFQKVTKLFLSEVDTAGDREDARSCVRCHTPLGHLSKVVETTEADYESVESVALGARSGIFCDFCHSVKSCAGVGNAPFLVDAGQEGSEQKTKWGPRSDAVSSYHQSAFSELHTRSEMCGMCHDVTHTLNGTPLERTYTEWREGPYNTGDPATTVYCQDCHMRQLPGVPATGSTERPDNPGISAFGGKERDHVYTHYFVGGNAVLPTLFGGEVNAQMAKERLQNCATLEITAPPLPLIWQVATIQVTVNNVGAGHYLPTGLSEVREMWLEVKVNALGRVLLHSGKVDIKGDLHPETRTFSIKLADKDGNHTVNVAKADHVLSDNRIPPKGSRTEQYSFLVPLTGILGYTIEATLKYRSASQSLIDDLFGEETFDLPIIEMASAEAAVKLID